MQPKVERYYYELRKGLFSFDEVLAVQRESTYSNRDDVLRAEPAAALASLRAESALVVGDIFEANWKAEGALDAEGAATLLGKLEQFFPQLPLTAEHADSLLRDARAGIDARERNAHLLSRHAEVLEVLEQPQLMDTCVRNNFVDEALELEAAARARALVYADVPAISQVAAQVRRRRHRHHH